MELGQLLDCTRLPRRVLRHVIFAHKVGVGSRVLVVGHDDGELVRFFDRLGFSASGFDETQCGEPSALGTSPPSLLDTGEEGVPLSAEQYQFDLVVVRDIGLYQGSLFSLPVLEATAKLLACVRSCGYLVFVQRVVTALSSDAGGHSPSCYVRHLSCFPGTCAFAEFRVGQAPSRSWQEILRFRRLSQIAAVSFHCPSQPIPRFDWLSRARAAAEAHAQPCCYRCQLDGSPDGRKSAA
jgi:hypothetical protein